MANISVDYKSIPKYTQTLRSQGNTLNKHFTAVYSKAAEMSKNWKGLRYNELMTEFNKLSPTINSMLQLVITNTP